MPVIDFDIDTEAFAGFKSHWGAERFVFTKQTEDFDQSAEADDMDASTWGARFENLLPAMQKSTSKIEGVHTDKRGYVGDVIRRWVGQSTPVRAWSAFESLNALSPVTFQPCSFKKYSVKAKKKEVNKFEAELGARGAFNAGTILVSPKSATTMATTGNGLDDDATSTTGATAFGGVAQMHIYDLAGGTTPGVTVVIQHSVDGSTWTTLVSFTVFNAASQATTFVQRVKVPSTTTVNAHVRAQWTTTGTPTSVQGIVMFARGVDPDL